MGNFFDMGGYASFIWPAWGLGVAVLIAITVRSVMQSNALMAKLDAAGKQADQPS